MRGHSNSIPQQRTATERRRRVHGQHGHPAPALPVGADQGRDRRRLARARWPGDAYDMARARRRGPDAHQHLVALLTLDQTE